MDVVHVHNGINGGVLNYIKRVIQAATFSNFPQRLIHVSNSTEDTLDGTHFFPARSNKHWMSGKFKKLLPKDAIVICHDSLSLQAISTAGLNNPTAMVLHGDYRHYYDLAKLFQNSVNIFLCVSKNIAKKLRIALPNRVQDIQTMWPIIPKGPKTSNQLNVPVRVAFIGRLTKSKGYNILPKIDQELQRDSIHSEWDIVGSGNLTDSWIAPNVRLHGQLDTSEVNSILSRSDVFILPSLREGMPLSVLEAMQAGLVCMVNEYSEGAHELIEHGVNGFIVSNNNPKDFAAHIKQIVNRPDKKREMGSKARAFVQEHFAAPHLSSKWEGVFADLAKIKNNRTPSVLGHSKLDQPWLPNFATKGIRQLLHD